jgi:hypothetical protein
MDAVMFSCSSVTAYHASWQAGFSTDAVRISAEVDMGNLGTLVIGKASDHLTPRWTPLISAWQFSAGNNAVGGKVCVIGSSASSGGANPACSNTAGSNDCAGGGLMCLTGVSASVSAETLSVCILLIAASSHLPA